MNTPHAFLGLVIAAFLIFGTSRAIISVPQELQTWPPRLPVPIDTKGATGPIKLPHRPPEHLGNRMWYASGVQGRIAGAEVALSTLKAPTERLDYFRDVLSDPACQLDGWYLCVREVKEADRLTVRVMPIISAPSIAARVLVIGAFDETYELKNGSLRLVNWAAVGNSPGVSRMGF